MTLWFDREIRQALRQTPPGDPVRASSRGLTQAPSQAAAPVRLPDASQSPAQAAGQGPSPDASQSQTLAQSQPRALTQAQSDTRAHPEAWSQPPLQPGPEAFSAPFADYIGAGAALPSAFDVAGLAAASVGAAASELAALAGSLGAGPAPQAVVDCRLAQLWFGMTLRPMGWQLPSPWDPLAGDYALPDGWLRLHTNAPPHRAAALAALGLAEDPAPDRAGITRAVQGWSATALQEAVVHAGGCAAEMLTREAWAAHPQGRAVAAAPLICWQDHGRPGDSATRWPLSRIVTDRGSPGGQAVGGSSGSGGQGGASLLAGLRVLDLTRVLAGPVATRFLAAFGATVLRIDPPHWQEPGLEAEVTPGKHCAGLDLRQDADRETFSRLLAGADVLVHGYRPGALDGLGFGAGWRQRQAPGLIDVSLSAWGPDGPWAPRRGFDSLVQMSSGIAAAGMVWAGKAHPVPLPVQALDHATGYLMAAAVLRALHLRLTGGRVLSAQLSLARTAALLMAAPVPAGREPLPPAGPQDEAAFPEATAWGPAQRLRFPVALDGISPVFARPASPFRSVPPAWPG